MMLLHFLSEGGESGSCWLREEVGALLGGGGSSFPAEPQQPSLQMVFSQDPHFPHKLFLLSGSLSSEPYNVGVLGSYCLQLQPCGCVSPRSLKQASMPVKVNVYDECPSESRDKRPHGKGNSRPDSCQSGQC